MNWWISDDLFAVFFFSEAVRNKGMETDLPHGGSYVHIGVDFFTDRSWHQRFIPLFHRSWRAPSSLVFSLIFHSPEGSEQVNILQRLPREGWFIWVTMDFFYNGWTDRVELVSKRVRNDQKGIPPYSYILTAPSLLWWSLWRLVICAMDIMLQHVPLQNV